MQKVKLQSISIVKIIRKDIEVKVDKLLLLAYPPLNMYIQNQCHTLQYFLAYGYSLEDGVTLN